ncbi:DUF6516 family protein [Bacillus sp. RO1]|uniref:toxin-antitoxin system TumE family protein n=1 Tax=Bacillus sp. RO1 TaxID=2722703 RepID=UPI0014575422|nr:DUF6516 family protein [Bacillus sp. RO1]NLP50240.1 hypothetical protein [Bacillus sp. RO1]
MMPSRYSLQKLIDKYPHLYQKGSRHNPNVENKPDAYIVKITLHLKHHPIYGKNRLKITETHYKDGSPKKYRYQWELNPPSLDKSDSHITAWENESHEDDPANQTKSEPHHHHHVPFDRTKRAENWHVRDIEAAIKEIEPFVLKGIAYTK